MSTPADARPLRPGRAGLRKMVLGAVLVALSAGAAFVALVFQELRDDLEPLRPLPEVPGGPTADDVLAHIDPGGPQTILVLGSDRRFADKQKGVPARSDTMLLIRLDPSKGATAVMNVPRDLRVNIPGFTRGKINAAYEYGGPLLAADTIRKVLHIPISHIVNVNFGGFRRAVDRLGCVYADVDRDYYHSNVGVPPRDQYSEIDVNAGYQRLCGEDALAYVRFRHADSDLVRAARQQDFLRSAKDQIGLGRLVSDRKKLLELVGDYTETDIRDPSALLRLLTLTARSAGKPVQEIPFAPVTDIEGSSDLAITPQAIDDLQDRFMNAEPPPKPKRPSGAATRRRRVSAPPRAGLTEAPTAAEDIAVRVATDPRRPLSFPVYYPRVIASGATYAEQDARAYRIRDQDRKHTFQAYRVVAQVPGSGEYYGVQGTTWKAPPILDHPDETRRLNGRTYQLFREGAHLRLVAWKTDAAVYWVSNTLRQALTNKQMLGIAESLTRVGA